MPELNLETLVLEQGAHTDGKTMCVMEAVAFVAGERWSDSPACACPVIAAFCRSWNDSLDQETRQRLKPYIPRLVGTKSTPEVENVRAWMATDWTVREFTPAWLELAGLTEHAQALRDLPVLDSVAAASAAQPKLEEARQAAAAAWDAARDAAWAAAWDAAWAAARAAARDAAWDAARDAARDAAWDAARDAAWDAAWDAARDAARAAARDAAWAAAWDAASKKLAPTVKHLQESAFQLLDRMIECKAEKAA